jgi:hypothetical protein
VATKNKPTATVRKGSGAKSSSLFSKKYFIAFIVGFALVGGYMLYRTFAATAYINYYGSLTSTRKSASYSLTAGAGTMSVSYTNNTKDVVLTVKNQQGYVLKSVKSQGRTPVKFDLTVTPGVYVFDLTTQATFNQAKGYSVKIDYPVQDLTAPTAVIVKPLASDTLKGTTLVTADAKDDSAVAKVEFLVDNVLLSSDPTAPYEANWDTTKVADGNHTLAVKSYDASGNSGQASATVVVDNVADIVRRFPGDPNPKLYGKTYWGAAIGGNADPVSRFEQTAGKSLSLRRTFWQWDNATNLSSGMYNTVAADVAANRLPFVSFKTPGWNALASGSYDAQLDAMLRKLDSYGKPVWLAAHHEPEGGGGANTPDDPGGAPAWRAMQAHIRQRMNAVGTKNVAFMPVLMSYTWDTHSGRTPADWWVPGIWDAYCVDHYQQSEANPGMITSVWNDFVAWAEARNMPFCTGEWGNRGSDATTASEMQGFWDWTFANKKDYVGYSYFDSGLNSPNGSWELIGDHYNKFVNILKNDTRVQRVNDL